MASPARDSVDERGAGWVAFAGVMIGVVGVLNVIYGIAAIDNSAFFVENERFVIFDDLNTWGWIHLIVGAIQVVAAFSIWTRNAFGAVVGIVTASLNAIVVLLWVSAFPVGGFAIFIIDLLVIYGLVAYGVRRREIA
ncbi:MAG TPA: hypothetical protein VFY99_02450 [Solirubrobacterales bacterium]